MSCGVVICATCSREVHQNGDPLVARGWRHCVDGTPLCAGGGIDYPRPDKSIIGPHCDRDRCPDEMPMDRSQS